ncbi:MAG: T9SS type A sorting domain-containing protein [Bacteroidales bacterium]|nr:T9SS type A sorting domain-containing protein [Bacteroidales bacterium]
MIRYLLIIPGIFLFFFFTASSQEVAIGQWRDHLPYKSGREITAGKGIIYCSTPYSLFYLDTYDNSLNRINTISGLSDVGVETIGFHKEFNTLVIAYSNTNLDLIKNGRVINMPDILKSNAVTPEEKTIHHLIFIDDLAYLSCGFGIVVLDVGKEEVKDTYYIGENGSHLRVYGLAADGAFFYAATEEGVFIAERSNANLAYYESWSRDERLPFPEAVYNHVINHAGRILVNKYSPAYGQDTVLFLEGTDWAMDMELFSDDDVVKMRAFNNSLYIVYSYFINLYDQDLNRTLNIWTYGDTGPNPDDVVTDENGVLWIADREIGLVKRHGDYDYESMHPNGPSTANVYAMASAGGELWMVPGGMTPWWSNLWIAASVSHFSESGWGTISRSTVPAYDTVRDMVSLAIDPFDNKRVFAGSWLHGVSEFYNHEFVRLYHANNSSLQPHLDWSDIVVKVAGLAFDQNGNLWATNSGANNILSVRQPGGTPEGKWTSFFLGSSSTGKDIGELIVDSYGQKWILMRDDHSIFVFDENNTIDDPADDQYKLLSSAVGNGNVPGNKIYSIAEDLDGEVWIGTDAGVGVFYSPENIFTGYDFDAQQILVPKNDGSGLADILFEFETITAIEVDGSNRKWIGTDRSGVFLISADGLEEIHHFTAENSPLFSNSISSLKLNPTTGELFIGTSKGLISYKGTATRGGETNSDVYAYPNPVRPGYNGVIAVKGLVTDADVKITDINGSLVFKGRSEGGQAIWDGRTMNGEKVQTGVYLVFISNDDGSETHVTKILFVN